MQRDSESGSGRLRDEDRQKLLSVAEKLDDLEALALARRRLRAVRNGEDHLVPLEQMMREFGV